MTQKTLFDLKDYPTNAGQFETDEFIECWNISAKACGWAQCLDWNNSRQLELKARLKDDRLFITNWRDALKRMRCSRFATDKRINNNWKPSIDYLLRNGKTGFVLEGRLDYKGTQPDPLEPKPDTDALLEKILKDEFPDEWEHFIGMAMDELPWAVVSRYQAEK